MKFIINLMTFELIILIILIPIIIIIKSTKNNRNKRNIYYNFNQTKPNIKTREEINQNKQYNQFEEEINNNNTNNANQYIKTELVTQYEQNLYTILSDVLKEKNYNNITILSKVRLADLIKSKSNNYAEFNKIKSKHIDFVLCDKQQLTPLLIVELDDNSHNNKQRRERDDFVNQSLVQAGYKILHIRNLDKNSIVEILEEVLKSDLPGVFYI